MKLSPISVELVDYMGSDLSVVNAARVSFQKTAEWENEHERVQTRTNYGQVDPSFVGVLSEKDQKLINYLAKHKHWTPFGHAFLSFRIKTSFAMARQLVKHQVGLVWNEVSRRYVDDPPEYYLPDVWRGKPVNAKQGSSDVTLTHFRSAGFNPKFHAAWVGDRCIEGPISDAVAELYTRADQLYSELISSGVSPEQARFILPLGGMTEWIWSGSLAAFARVCKLRLDPHAQKEVQDVAKLINDLIPSEFQHSWKALMEN